MLSVKWSQPQCVNKENIFSLCSWSMYEVLAPMFLHVQWYILGETVILSKLERLRSEDTPYRLMITHIIDSYWIPSQHKTKWKLQI